MPLLAAQSRHEKPYPPMSKIRNADIIPHPIAQNKPGLWKFKVKVLRRPDGGSLRHCAVRHLLQYVTYQAKGGNPGVAATGEMPVVPASGALGEPSPPVLMDALCASNPCGRDGARPSRARPSRCGDMRGAQSAAQRQLLPPCKRWRNWKLWRVCHA